jgi:hypothetical protein
MNVRGDQRAPDKPAASVERKPKGLITVNAKGGKKGGGGPHIHVHVDKVVMGRYPARKSDA